jgi:hypothetical protein
MVLLIIIGKERSMPMNTYKENCKYHVVKRFNERFKTEDFMHNTKKYGMVDFKNEVASAIVNAPKMGKNVKGGKGFKEIFKIRIMDTKAVFVVWDMEFNIPVTVLTSEMWAKWYA